MKILHITPSYCPATKYGGPISSIHLLNKAFQKKSIKINVITTNAGIDKIKFNTWLKYENINVKYIKYYGYEYYNFSPQMILEILRLVNKYDIITMSSVWCFPTLIGGIVSILFKKPYIIFPHGALSSYSINIKSKLKKIIYFNIIIKYILKRAAKIRYTTKLEYETSIFSNNNNNNYIILPHGIDLYNHLENSVTFSTNMNFPSKYILFMGRLHPIKGLDILLEAFKKITFEYKDIYLIVAGAGGNYFHQLNQFIENNNLNDKVRFIGFISGKLKSKLIKNATLFVIPSYYENFCLAAVEAMSYGLPIIISNKVGIYSEIEKYNAGIVVDTNSESLYRGIKTLLVDNKLRKTISINGKKLVEKYYNIDKIADEMINIFNEII